MNHTATPSCFPSTIAKKYVLLWLSGELEGEVLTFIASLTSFLCYQKWTSSNIMLPSLELVRTFWGLVFVDLTVLWARSSCVWPLLWDWPSKRQRAAAPARSHAACAENADWHAATRWVTVFSMHGIAILEQHKNSHTAVSLLASQSGWPIHSSMQGAAWANHWANKADGPARHLFPQCRAPEWVWLGMEGQSLLEQVTTACNVKISN